MTRFAVGIFTAALLAVLAAMGGLFGVMDAYGGGLVLGFMFGGLAVLAVAAVAAPMLLHRLPELDQLEDEPDGGALLVPDGWEYETSITREVDDSGLVYAERFTLLVPRPGRVVRVERPQTKQLTVGRDS